MKESVEQINARIDDLIAQRNQINELLRDARSTKASLTRQNADSSNNDNESKVTNLIEFANFKCAEVSNMILVELEENMVRFIIYSYEGAAKFKDTYWIDYDNSDTIESMEKWLNRHLDLLSIYDTLVVDDYSVHFVSEYYEDYDADASIFTIVYKDKSYLDVTAKSDDDIKMTLSEVIEDNSDMTQFCFEKSDGVEYEITGKNVKITVTTTENCDLESMTQTLQRMKDKLSDC